MGIKTLPHPPYSLDLAPCDFCLFPKLRGCRNETIEKMKEAVTKVIDTLTQVEFHGTFQKLLERYNKMEKILRRGLEFHVCTINKSVHTKKSLEAYRMHLVCLNLEFSYSLIVHVTKTKETSLFNNLIIADL